MKEVVICGKGNLSLKILKWFFERKKIYKIKSFVPAITKEINAPEDWDNNEIRKNPFLVYLAILFLQPHVLGFLFILIY